MPAQFTPYKITKKESHQEASVTSRVNSGTVTQTETQTPIGTYEEKTSEGERIASTSGGGSTSRQVQSSARSVRSSSQREDMGIAVSFKLKLNNPTPVELRPAT